MKKMILFLSFFLLGFGWFKSPENISCPANSRPKKITTFTMCAPTREEDYDLVEEWAHKFKTDFSGNAPILGVVSLFDYQDFEKIEVLVKSVPSLKYEIINTATRDLKLGIYLDMTKDYDNNLILLQNARAVLIKKIKAAEGDKLMFNHYNRILQAMDNGTLKVAAVNVLGNSAQIEELWAKNPTIIRAITPVTYPMNYGYKETFPGENISLVTYGDNFWIYKFLVKLHIL